MSQIAVRDVVSTHFVGVSESDSLRGAVGVLRDEDASAALVLRGGDVVGLLTSGDVLDHLDELADATVADAMGEPPAEVRPEASVSEAAERMQRTGVGYVVARDADGVRGIVEAVDLVGVSDDPLEEPDLTPTVTPEETDGGKDTAFSTQSICEVCGSLATSLSNVNGQLVCSDCHSV